MSPDDPDTGTLAVQRAERVGERLGQRRAQATQATAAAARWRRVLLLGLPVVAGLALLGSVAAVVIAVNASTTRAEDVAQRVTPAVTERVIADSRAGRAVAARSLLAEANARNAARGLPIIADPGRDAPADEVVGAWVTARVIGALPPTVADELAEQVRNGGTPRVLPSVALPSGIDPTQLGDVTVTVLPENDPPVRTVRPVTPDRGAARPAPAAPRPGTATRAPTPSRPAPAPAPPPSRPGGLLRPCLLGAVLC